ncbi:FUSC family protein [Gluconacetobacter azotocaptans]|uniref:FUSC family protein n=4 Tax=Gluconacetobacter azotocaptans TaxID=142834 RepID=A0A7W4JVV3_9PROT|nr:FUSC family protein [Gluconacetobacter azotocaptans]
MSGAVGRMADSGARAWGKPWGEPWRWLMAPSPADLGFAVRTSAAAILSLLIAMWMELDSPQWAPLSVWVVATASRGESLSKARWRLVGTAVGCCAGVALIAAFPQETGLFFVGLALWMGLCCGCATFFDGYRSYGLLVTSFTSAIVATGAISQPDHVFDVAMARGTYIVLGIACEAGMAALFLPGVRAAARARLPGRLRGLADRVASGVAASSAGRPDVEAESGLLADLVAVNARVEFDVLEMGAGQGRSADHARAALAYLLAVLARARSGVRGAALDRDLGAARRHIQAIAAPRVRDPFRFGSHSPRQAIEALHNGLRAALGIIGAWLVWEVTAWPAGPAFVSFVALVYGLLATREVPALASAGFYRGAMWCAAVAGLYVALVIPAVTSPECLVLLLVVPMIAGGLAARTPRLVNHAFAFNLFFPVLLGPSNLGRYDEVSFLNGALAFLAAVLFARLTFGLVLPFRADNHLRRTAAWVERRLRALARGNDRSSVPQWLAANADSMVRAVRTCRDVPRDEMLRYMGRHLDAMALGMWVIELRDAARSDGLPAGVRLRLRVFLRAWIRQGAQARDVARQVLRHVQRHPDVRPDVLMALRGLTEQ